jgi:hypothetical protein
MPDPYANIGSDILGPACNAYAVVASDTADLPFACKALYVGTTGDVTLVTIGGDTVKYVGVPGGSYLFVRAARVKTTGTTASNIVAEY